MGSTGDITQVRYHFGVTLANCGEYRPGERKGIVSMNDQQRDSTAKYMYDLSKGIALLTVIKPLWEPDGCDRRSPFEADVHLCAIRMGLHTGREEIIWTLTHRLCFSCQYLPVSALS